MNYTKNFTKLNKNAAQIAGGKGASLGEMINAKIPVPGGFVVLAQSFERFIELTDINVEIDSIIKKVNHKKINTIEQASKKIQTLILNAEIPKEISDEIFIEYKKLKSKHVAVRSSATSEDSADAAWAGQLDSFLNTTEKNLLENVKKCWASLFTPRAIFYRFEKGLNKTKISVAVVVQKMVASEISGIAFSVHPVTEDYNQIIIEAGYGLGEAIVSGQITPDSYVISKKPLAILDKNISAQERGLYRHASGDGNEWKSLTSKVGGKQCLTDAQIKELSKLIIKIENHYGFPCDIEWAYEKGKFYIVQSRPITTLLKNESSNYDNKGVVILEKAFSREKSLMYMMMWDVSERIGYKKFLNYKLQNSLFIYDKETRKTSVWYSPKETNLINSAISSSLNRDKKLIEKIINCLDNNWQAILPYLKFEKKINTKQQFIIYYKAVTNWWSAMNTVYPLINVPELSPKAGKIFLRYRKLSEKYTGRMDTLIIDFANKYLSDENKESSGRLLIEELFEDSKKVKKIFEKRKAGYFISSGKVFSINTLDSFLDKNNLKLNIENIGSSNEITGTSAYLGKVRGRVKIIINKNDISSFNDGEILVAETTYPDHVPMMKKAAAFITDEGGLTCHAAIAARELKKPCIVGTKIATQVLKDGDLVEVDADKGVVRVIKDSDSLNVDNKSLIDQLEVGEWEFEFQQRDQHPVIMADQWSMALYKNYEQELGFKTKGYDCLFTSSNKGYNKIRQKQYIMNELIKNSGKQKYIDRMNKKTLAALKKIDNFAKKTNRNINKLNRLEVKKYWFEFNNLFLTAIPWFYIPYYFSENNFLTDKVKRLLIKHRNKVEKITDLNNALILLTFPTRQTILQKEQNEFFKLLCLAKNKKDYSKQLKKYLLQFGFVKTYLELPLEPLTVNDLKIRINEELKNEVLTLFKKQSATKIKNERTVKLLMKVLKNDKKLTKAIKNSQQLGWLLSYSVEYLLRSTASLIPFYKKIARLINVNYSDWINLTIDEIANALISGQVDTNLIAERKKGYVYLMVDGKKQLLSGDEAVNRIEFIEKKLDKRHASLTGDFKGVSVFAGKVTGRVRVIMQAQNAKNLVEGEILVCGMTSPDYVTAMKKSGAVITDEGGLLCHAAIISREINKPCIVGTKIATQVLKDGDFVEVDADKGVVKILTKN